MNILLFSRVAMTRFREFGGQLSHQSRRARQEMVINDSFFLGVCRTDGWMDGRTKATEP